MGEEANSAEELAVGKRIAAARKRKRLLQADLARQLGLNQQRISSWENGEELPNTPSGWRDLCDALGVSSDYLLFGRTAGLSDEAIFKGWEEVNTDHYEADLGELGKISVTYDPTAGHWTAWAFGTARPGHPTAAEAQAVAVRMVREESAFAGNRWSDWGSRPGGGCSTQDGGTWSVCIGHEHRGGAAMKHFAGLDVSLEETAICVVDEAGTMVREARVPSEPEALVAFFRGLGAGRGADRPGGVLAVCLAAREPGRGGPAGGVHRDPTGQGGHGRHAEQDGPQRRARASPRSSAPAGTGPCT